MLTSQEPPCFLRQTSQKPLIDKQRDEPSPKKTSELARWTKDTSPRRQNRPRTRGEAEEGGHVAHTAIRLLLSHLQIHSTAMKTESPRHLRNPLLVLLFLAAAAAAPLAQIAMAAEPEQVPAAQEAAVHIVYVDRPEEADPEEFHIRTLAPVLGRYRTGESNRIHSRLARVCAVPGACLWDLGLWGSDLA